LSPIRLHSEQHRAKSRCSGRHPPLPHGEEHVGQRSCAARRASRTIWHVPVPSFETPRKEPGSREVRVTHQLASKAGRARWFETRTGQRQRAARYAPHHEGVGMCRCCFWHHRKMARGPARYAEPLIVERYQPACKPGFVGHHPLAWTIRDGHSSGTLFAHGLEQPTRTASLTSPCGVIALRRTSRVAVPIRFCSRCGLPCRFRCRTRGALLPHLFTLTAPKPPKGRRRAVRSLWHCPWGRPRRTLSGTVCRWSPDFPLPQPFDRSGSGRPAD